MEKAQDFRSDDTPAWELQRHSVDVFHVQQILLGARHRGLDVQPLLRRAAIAHDLLESPLARVTQAQCAALLRVLRRVLRDEFWGLLDRPLRPGTCSLACQAMIRAASLEEAMRAGLAHYRLQIDAFVPRLQIHDGVASLRIFERDRPSLRLRYAASTFLFWAFGLASWLVGRRLPLLAVDFAAAPQKRKLDTERMFCATTRYMQPCTAMHFDAVALKLRVTQDASTLTTLLGQMPAPLLVRFREDDSLQELVRRNLRQRLKMQMHRDELGELPSLEDMAGAMKLTAPTLRRRLWEAGSSYSSIKDGLRRDAAVATIERGELSLQELGLRLGFSEPSAFHRAFKKWTGVPPGVYRDRVMPR